MCMEEAIKISGFQCGTILLRNVSDNSFIGFCKYDGEDIVCYDGDNYSLKDVVKQHYLHPDKNYLTVWY